MQATPSSQSSRPPQLPIRRMHVLISRRTVSLSHEPNVDDLVYMSELIEADKVKPVIDRVFPFGEIAKAMRYHETGDPQGKVVLTMGVE